MAEQPKTPSRAISPGLLPPTVPTAILAGLLAFYFWGIPIAGVLVAGVWLVLVFARTQFATAESGNRHAYAEVWSHLQYLQKRLEDVQDPGTSTSGQASAQSANESTRMITHAKQIDREIKALLESRGAQWTSSTGYVQLWQLAHRVEELLLMAEADAGVAARGLYEERRLVGAQIAEVDELLAQVRHAVVTLDPTAAPYLKQMPPAPVPTSASNGEQPRNEDSQGGSGTGGQPAVGGGPAADGGAAASQETTTREGTLAETPSSAGNSPEPPPVP